MLHYFFLFPAVEEQIIQYHRSGYNIKTIQKFLEQDGVPLSYYYLRNKVVPRLGLSKRAGNRVGRVDLLNAVMDATNDGASTRASASHLTHTLRVDMGLNVIQRDVAAAQRALAPEMVEQRRLGRLRRRTYRSEGANYIWHVDGYDKLAPYGLPIHGCVDGFSRYILWLKLGPTNRRPEQTCNYFLEAVEQYGLPHTVRIDAGTENTNIRWAQNYLATNLPRLTPLQPVLTGSSNHNKRIERFWGLLRLQKVNWWMDHFKDLIGDGEMVAWEDIDRHVAYYAYNHLVRSDLESMIAWHNAHRIRKQRNNDIVTGKPTVLYRLPENYGFRQCKQVPQELHVDVAKVALARNIPFDPDYTVVIEDLIHQFNLVYPPTDVAEADALYTRVRNELHHRLD